MARVNPPLISVVIPALRPPLGLAAWLAQDLPFELLILANGDFRETDPLLRDARVRVLRVPWEGHGATRQRGITLAQANYVLLSVDDAVPLGRGFLRQMVGALQAGGYRAVWARQIPAPQADPVTQRRLLNWCPPGVGHVPSVRVDHVATLYARETLLSDPLDAVPIAEDWHWARRQAPGSLGYVADALIQHSHPRQFWPLYTRTRDLHRQFRQAGERPLVPNIVSFLRLLPGTLGRDFPGALGELLGQWRS